MERRTFEESFRDAFKDAEATPSDQVWKNIDSELEKGRIAMEAGAFEHSLRNALKDAEAVPSEQVWNNVELELEKEKGARMRRTLVFYRMLAAAAVTLALLSTGVAWFIINKRNQTIEQMVADAQRKEGNGRASEQRALMEADATQRSTKDAAIENVAPGAARARTDNNEAHKTRGSQGQRNPQSGSSNRLSRSRGDVAATLSGSQADNGDNSHGGDISRNSNAVNAIVSGSLANGNSAHSRDLPAFYTPNIQQPTLPTSQVDPVKAMLAKLAEEEMKYASNEKGNKKDLGTEKVWTALGVAAGGFSSVSHSTAPVQSPSSLGFSNSNNQAAADKQARASGVAYSLGLSFGTKVAPRWVIQGGVNYLTQSSNYTANNVVYDAGYSLQAESINALGKIPALADAADAQKLAPTVPYSVNNSLKYFSVPMQAGYLVVNRKFGVQLNAGISTDLFLQNTITPEGGSLDKTTQSSGSDSPYRTVNFSGLMGTEFSYRLGQRYRVALNPALRYPLSSVYKSDVGIQSSPLTFDVGLRFRYIFK